MTRVVTAATFVVATGFRATGAFDARGEAIAEAATREVPAGVEIEAGELGLSADEVAEFIGDGRLAEAGTPEAAAILARIRMMAEAG